MFLVSLVDLKVYAFIFYAIGDLGPILFLTLSHAMMSSIFHGGGGGETCFQPLFTKFFLYFFFERLFTFMFCDYIFQFFSPVTVTKTWM